MKHRRKGANFKGNGFQFQVWGKFDFQICRLWAWQFSSLPHKDVSDLKGAEKKGRGERKERKWWVGKLAYPPSYFHEPEYHEAHARPASRSAKRVVLVRFNRWSSISFFILLFTCPTRHAHPTVAR